ncbi:HlyD family secretion protein [Methylobacterium sp. J-090]|uniref:HlyD family secretion protein n=1 Tax=Methylobacterium sp. J-090 TaxID=2836666 RepID=UPI001FB8682D|nr:HlyD family efflux transporter periplasmic adaptor subunit [Methylobacterium sp. J-090]MCJ2082087.1 HlyD family secretion protein [Methylobacterium sp. J-090]
MLLKRALKLTAGVAFAGIGVAAASNGRYFTPVNDAFINGKLISLRAGANGIVNFGALPFGALVSEGDVLAEIAPPRVSGNDPPTVAEGDLPALEAQIASLEALAAEKSRQAELYRLGRVKHLEAKIAETRAAVLMLREKERQATALRERQEELFSRNYIARVALVNGQSAEASARIEREMIERRIEGQTLELAAARQGTFIGDGYNDTSYSKQRADEIAVRLSELRADLLRKRLGNQQASLAAAVLQKAALSAGAPPALRIPSPADGKIWKVLVNRGDVVRAGEEILQIVDCGTLFVTVDAVGRTLDGVAPGRRAVFTDEGRMRIEGTVIFATGADRGFDAVIGGALTQRRPDATRTSIVVALKPDATDHARCPIGLKGQVAFLDEEMQASALPSLFRRLTAQATAMVGWPRT